MARRKRGILGGGMGLAGMAMQSAMLAMEANQVIALRLAKLAQGGPAAQREAALMVAEKAAALAESGGIAAGAVLKGQQDLGGKRILRLYRRKVRANRRRLGASAFLGKG